MELIIFSVSSMKFILFHFFFLEKNKLLFVRIFLYCLQKCVPAFFFSLQCNLLHEFEYPMHQINSQSNLVCEKNPRVYVSLKTSNMAGSRSVKKAITTSGIMEAHLGDPP